MILIIMKWWRYMSSENWYMFYRILYISGCSGNLFHLDSYYSVLCDRSKVNSGTESGTWKIQFHAPYLAKLASNWKLQ